MAYMVYWRSRMFNDRWGPYRLAETLEEAEQLKTESEKEMGEDWEFRIKDLDDDL